MVAETYVLHVTKECNCACRYCYEQDKTSKYTWEEVKDTFDNIIKNRTSNEIHIEFLGGEPMMAWNYIKGILDYSKTFPEINFSFTITNNGTIVNDELIAYLKDPELRLRYAISEDGNKWSNQLRVFKSGKNTFDKVMENIDILLAEGLVHKIGIHITTHIYNIAYFSDSVDFLYNKGIREIDTGTVEGLWECEGLDPDYIERFILEHKIVSDRIKEGKYPGLSMGMFSWVKPKEDVRTYVRDRNGKLVAESYGRAGEDFTYKYPESEGYQIIRCDNQTQISKDIYYIRSTVYKNHHINIGDFDRCEYRHVFDE